MKTYTAPLPHSRQIQIPSGEKFFPAMAASIRVTLALLAAIATAAAVVMLSVWAAGLEMNGILGASSWGLGLVFLGLAVDNREPRALLQLVTGLALLVLAWLQAYVSPEYIIASGSLLAVWVAASLFKQLR